MLINVKVICFDICLRFRDVVTGHHLRYLSTEGTGPTEAVFHKSYGAFLDKENESFIQIVLVTCLYMLKKKDSK